MKKFKLFVHTAIAAAMLLPAVQFVGNAENATLPSSPIANDEVQNNTVRLSGKVTDANGSPLAAVAVYVPGASGYYATSDFDGNFSINAPKGSTVTFSLLGYKDASIEASDNNSNLVIALEDEANFLDESVVVGYAVQKKANLTGAVSSVSSDVFESRPVSDVSHALQGVSPGLNITSTSRGGELGQPMQIDIRGIGTIGSGSVSQPLVLIDGIEGDLNALSPFDIESISVLKDAASASIYGARAAFGVILITTKQGTSGKTRVSYNGEVRFSSAIQIPDTVDSYTYATYLNEINVNAGIGAPYTNEALQRIQYFQQGRIDASLGMNPSGISDLTGDNILDAGANAYGNSNIYDAIYRSNAPSHNHTLSISGGNDKVTYSVNASYLGAEGLLRYCTDDFKHINTNAKIGVKLAPWARFNYSMKFSRQDHNRPTYMRNTNMDGSFFRLVATYAPTNPIFDANGNWTRGTQLEWMVNGGDYNETTDYLTQQAQFVFEPVKDWHITLDGSYQSYYQTVKIANLPVKSYLADGTRGPWDPYGQFAPGTSILTDGVSNQDYYTINLVTDYSKSFGNHNFKVMGGFNGELKQYAYRAGEGRFLNSLSNQYLDQTTADFRAYGNAKEMAIAGFFGRLNYDYDGRYLFEANFRYDGTSLFVGDNRWGFFPSFSAGWNIAKEPWMKNANKVVQLLKLRGSWGQLGNCNLTSWYPTYQTIEVKTGNSSWIEKGIPSNTAYMPNIVSSSLTWETIQTLDFGLDFSLFNNRLTGIFDWYSRKTLGMVGPGMTLPTIIGADSPNVNNCDLKTNGWELELSWRDHVGDFHYGAKLVLSDYQSTVLSYPNDTKSLSQPYYAGQKIGEIWGYEANKLAQTQAEMDAWLQNNKPQWGSNWGAGDIMFVDQNGDGIVSTGNNTADNPGDRMIIGNSTPRYHYGINLDAAWKGFDIAVFLQGIGKRDYDFGNRAGDFTSGFWGAVGNAALTIATKETMNYWRPDNPDGYLPKPYLGNITKNTNYGTTMYLQDASYCRIKNLQLGYTFPAKWMDNAGISRLRVYFSVDNLHTFSKMPKQFDPEANDGPWGIGEIYPLSRTWSFGVNVNF